VLDKRYKVAIETLSEERIGIAAADVATTRDEPAAGMTEGTEGRTTRPGRPWRTEGVVLGPPPSARPREITSLHVPHSPRRATKKGSS
jgi:hypothetical protein